MLPTSVAPRAQTETRPTPAPPELIVEPEWLAARLGNADLRIIDVRDRACYDEGHLRGAVWLDRNALSLTRPDRSVTLIPALPFAAQMGRLGIGGGTRVVVYDDVWGMHAARVVWALQRYGHGHAAVLSGGAEAWTAAGHALTRGALVPYPSLFVPGADDAQWADLGWVQARTGDRAVLLLDVRGAHEYAEERLAGARHWEWSRGTPTGSWAVTRPPDELRAELRRHGIVPERRIVTYCTSGMRAAHTYLLLRSLGYPDVRVLDAPWRSVARLSGGRAGR